MSRLSIIAIMLNRIDILNYFFIYSRIDDLLRCQLFHDRFAQLCHGLIVQAFAVVGRVGC